MFQLKPSVFISEVCHVIVNHHVTNVEEWRRGPRPNCETERTGAPLSVQGWVRHPFPYGFLYSRDEGGKGGRYKSGSLCLRVRTRPSSPFLNVVDHKINIKHFQMLD